MSDVIGMMLDHMRPQIRAACEDWIGRGEDIAELVLVLNATPDGGTIHARSRADIAGLGFAGVRANHDILYRVCFEVVKGQPGKIPVVIFLSVSEPASIELVWLDPIDPAELH